MDKSGVFVIRKAINYSSEPKQIFFHLKTLHVTCLAECYEELALGLHYKYGTRCPLPADGRLKTPVFLVQPAYDFWQSLNHCKLVSSLDLRILLENIIHNGYSTGMGNLDAYACSVRLRSLLSV
ncbi:hypothetical protein K1719_037084 [Acacia pycnantha]|nr:hypothetical protein K1719_037084 [Acacia pycnantha]